MQTDIFLSKTEKEIISMIWEEFSHEVIAEQMQIKIAGVEWHIGNIYKKLGLKGCKRIGLIKYALQKGIVQI